MAEATTGMVRLKCNGCGPSDVFVPVVHLIWGQGKGLTTEHGGYQCQQCGALVDSAHLINLHQLRVKAAEVKAMEQELIESGGAKALAEVRRV